MIEIAAIAAAPKAQAYGGLWAQALILAPLGLVASALFALGVAVLSLDDLYLTRAQRQRLALDVHPLLATRGPPGSHDLAHLVKVLAAFYASDLARAREAAGLAPDEFQVLPVGGTWHAPVGAEALKPDATTSPPAPGPSATPGR